MVGATGLEPARLAPKDPKSFVSANSTTRPRDAVRVGALPIPANLYSARKLFICVRSFILQYQFKSMRLELCRVLAVQ